MPNLKSFNASKDFFCELAKEITSEGFRCFLYENTALPSCWMYVVTPGDSLLYISHGYGSGYNIYYEYVPSREFGSGCLCNSEPLHEITADILLAAERFGLDYKGPGKYPSGLSALFDPSSRYGFAQRHLIDLTEMSA